MREMARRQFLGGVAVSGLGLAGCASRGLPAVAAPSAVPPAGVAPSARTDALLAEMAEQMLAEYPENATSLGIDTGARAALKHRLVDRTPAGRSRLAAGARARLALLNAIDTSDLAAPGALDAAVTRIAHEITDEGYRFGYGDVLNLDNNWGYRNTPYVVNQLSGAFVEVPDFLDSRHPVTDAKSAEAYVDRVAAYAASLDGETERLAHDRGIGVVAPDFTLDKTIATIGAGAAVRPEAMGIVTTLDKAVAEHKLSPSLAAAVRALARDRVAPALARQLDELKRHRAVATADAGAWKLPEGAAYYRWALKAATTTTMAPDEIHRIGQEQVRAIQARMDAILVKQGMRGGTVGARMAALGRDPAQLYPDTPAGRAQLLAYLNQKVDDIRGRLPRAFATLVPGRLVIKRVPEAIEDGAPGGYAAAGSIDGSVPGQYYINLKSMAEWPRFSLPTLTYHEGIPGHIWQGEYANRAALVRSLLAFNAYSEGWALYAEQLADELGVYDEDPLGALGYLQSSSFRACRLVVDTGLHALRWGREQAIDWFVTTNGDDRGSVAREVDRYCAWPGQACGYKLGHLEIVRLRERAQAAMGGAYDLRTFNDALVKGGSVPMGLLEKVIDAYIAGGVAAAA